MKSGILFCLSGPSGSGKTTLSEEFKKQHPFVSRITTVTTRNPRDGEQNGIDYHFWSKGQFEDALSENLFFEHEVVHGNYYGTLKGSLEQVIDDKKIAFIILDVNGAITLKNTFHGNVVNVFLSCSRKNDLRIRLEDRGTEPEDAKRRLASADQEQLIYSLNSQKFDYLIINDSFCSTVSSLANIFKHELVKRGELLTFEDWL